MATALVENEDQHHDIPEEQVAIAAYFIWREGGCRHGCDLDDWYAAIEKFKRAKPSGRVIHRDALNSLSLKQGLRGDSISQERVNGLPVKEQMRVETPDGESASEDVTRSEGNSTVSRSLSHPAPYRQEKDDEQIAAVQYMLGDFNELNGTDYEQLEPDKKDRETDVWAMSRGAGRKQAFQVTKCDSEPWKTLASPDASFTETLSEDDLLTRFVAAIDAKKHRAYGDIVLVLEGWPPINRSVLERLSKEVSEHLAKIGFQEIWYSERGPGGQVRRLYPVAI